MVIDLYNKYITSSGVCTDTRQLVNGNIFFALKGDNFDGNQYARHALELGASYVVVDDPNIGLLQNGKCILVDNVLQTLQDLATFHRRQIELPVIAITGSNGKTTTKELLHAVLSSKYRTFATKGNYNNHIGVPLSLLSISSDIEMAIIEMGANHLEEIKALCKIAEPTHGLITNIGKAHLEGFGSVENIIKGKTELYDYLNSTSGKTFVQPDDEILSRKSKGNKSDITLLPVSDFTIKETFPSIKFNYKGVDCKSDLTGKYNVANIRVAVSVGLHFDIPLKDCLRAISAYQPVNNRSEVRNVDNVTYIMDSYNANPSSMNESILNAASNGSENFILVLGDMKELGDYEEEEHLNVLDLIANYHWKGVYTVGSVFSSLESNTYNKYKNVTELKASWDAVDKEGGVVLLKGSRSITLERLLQK